MSVSWPFDSTVTQDGNGNPIYSRAYSADVLARILTKYFRNGVFTGVSTSMQVVAATGMSVTVKAGDALINGHHYYAETDTAMNVDAADASLPRIDTVVLRLNLAVNVLSIALYINKGTAASSPSAPALTRIAGIWEVGLADLLIPAASTSIPQSRITDTRLDSTKCGVVASIIGDTNTSTYYAQIAADLAEFKADREADFDAWFAVVVSTLGENEAGNLLNMINALDADVVKYSVQSRTGAEKTQARTNIGAWEPPTLLWTNPNPGSSFANQTISGTWTGYTSFLIEYTVNIAQVSHKCVAMMPSGESSPFHYLGAFATNYWRTTSINTGGAYFAEGYYRADGGAATADNTKMIPYKIWGLKGITL